MQKLQLSIPEPCHENWHTMTPTDQGRFCNACTKEVIDFSMMTDTEILNYFSTLTQEKVCGRALPSQLDRTISKPKDPKKRLFWYWNYIAMFIMFFSKSNSAKAQGGIKPVTEISPVKTAGNNRGETIITSRMITGKVIDMDGNPVSFATIKIKETNSGVSANANGTYSIRVRPVNVLLISAAGFKETEVHPEYQDGVKTTVLQKTAMLGGAIVVVVDNYNTEKKQVAVFKVKDDQSGLPIDKAKIMVVKNQATNFDTAFTDKKGTYKLKGIRRHENYFIKVEAAGYEANEFTINDEDFSDKKKEWEVLLRKQKEEAARSTERAKPGKDTTVRLGQVSANAVNGDVLYVVDGVIMTKAADINPDDVEDYRILQGPEAMALFGADGANGAIVITTRKRKEKTLDSVIIVSGFGIKRTTHCGTSCVNTVNVDSLPKSVLLSTNNINIFPNPVQRGNSFDISLQLKQTGNCNIQITDASGKILLQKQIKVITKEHVEKMQADSRWASGIYNIRVVDNKNQLISTKSFIFI